MKTDLKQEYLNKKYTEYDDESDAPYIHKRPNRRTKKSKHKHEYENCYIHDSSNPDSFGIFASRCKVCGKIGDTQTDKRIERKFPHVSYKNSFATHSIEHEQEYEDFVKWFDKHYNTYDVPGFDICKTKYI